MSSYRFTNNATTTLGSAISPTDTTIVVASGTGTLFPVLAAGHYFMATLSASSTGLPNEIVKVTARVGDTMTVVRGQENTTAASWSIGNRFSNFVTAGFLNVMTDSAAVQTQSGNYAVDSGTANAGVISLVPAPASYAALVGVPIRIKKMAAQNTGVYTVNVNGLGTAAVNIGDLALEGGELSASCVFEIIFNGATFNLVTAPTTVHGDRLAVNSVPNSALEQMVAQTFKGNLGGATATPYDVPLADLIAALGFGSSSFASNGYYTLPGGLIIQWGTNNAPTDGHSGNFTFPNGGFPNNCFAAVGNTYSSNYLATNGNKAGITVVNKTLYNVYSDDVGVPVTWIAIGN